MGRYDERFMSGLTDGASIAASLVLPIVFAELGVPTSAIEVGCGTAAWGARALELGVEELTTVDGPYARDHLVAEGVTFLAADLSRPLRLDRRFDLAMSIEVAEHLPPERAPGFVADLCALSDHVLFSAAVPGQPGTHHINLRWPSYWADLFERNGYGVIDCVRPSVWTTAGDVWPVAQNAFLFVHGSRSRLSMPIDVAHPRHVEGLIAPMGIRSASLAAASAVAARLQRMLRRVSGAQRVNH
jgi:hypothetical protein